MTSVIGSVAKRRELLAVIIAAGMLAAIFIPFQTATAFTVTIDLPDDDDDTISQSAAGESFEIVIDVEAGELISISNITLILDNDESSVNVATFDDDGSHISGGTNLVVNNALSISTFSDSGYGYGVGLVSDGSTFSSPYSYSFTYSNTFIGGNTLGYSNIAGGTNFATGLLGPGTLTISGNLRTATLAEGDHTLDVLIDTGAGGNDEDQLTAPTFDFTVEEDDSLVVTEEPVTLGATTADIATTDSEGNDIDIELNFGAATTTTGNVVVVVQNVDDFIAANTEAELEAQGFTLVGDDQLEFVTDDPDTTFIAVGFIVDIDISALGLPAGTEVTLSMTYDDSGLSNAEENDARLMHQLDTLIEWEALTNDDEDINDGDEVDTDANIVYGTTDDFSLFAPAVEAQDDDDDDAPSGGGGGGGGSRTVVITWPGVDTLPSSHFINFPLDRIQVASSAFVNAAGISITNAQVNQQVSIAGEFTNQQPTEQTYAFIVQVTDEAGFVTDIAWQQGVLDAGSTADVSTLWTPETDGTFTVQIFVWNSISATPEPLSEVTVKNINVSE